MITLAPWLGVDAAQERAMAVASTNPLGSSSVSTVVDENDIEHRQHFQPPVSRS
jgi:hypothetical protein